MDLPINENRTTEITSCRKCGATHNSPEDGGNTGCFHCVCGWIECGDLDLLRELEIKRWASASFFLNNNTQF